MIYLDYSATTPVNHDVLNTFLNNVNNSDIDVVEEKKKVQKLLKTNLEVIYTSGSTEANNLAIKGIAFKYLNSNDSYHIITTDLEHSSINEQMKYLERNGFVIDYVKLNDGIVDLDDLRNLITDKTVLVSIASVNSETGIVQPINEIGCLLANYSQVIFHSDMTQSMGKVEINLDNVDMISFAAHKFYGLKGIGCLLKKKEIGLVPLIYGERKLNLALVQSLGNALADILANLKENYDYVLKLNETLKRGFSKYNDIKINSTNYCLPHILNISVDNFKPETFQHTLELYDIYISTKSACSKSNDYSKAVFSLTKDMNRAKTSVRISLSSKTKKDDVNKLLKVIAQLFD